MSNYIASVETWSFARAGRIVVRVMALCSVVLLYSIYGMNTTHERIVSHWRLLDKEAQDRTTGLVKQLNEVAAEYRSAKADREIRELENMELRGQIKKMRDSSQSRTVIINGGELETLTKDGVIFISTGVQASRDSIRYTAPVSTANR